MPQPTFHLLLAHEVLDRWNGAGPFDTHDSANRNAFFHGAIGPDMGFFPGTNRLISELAHTSLAGELTRQLAAHARTETTLAFAYGWATHIVAMPSSILTSMRQPHDWKAAPSPTEPA